MYVYTYLSWMRSEDTPGPTLIVDRTRQHATMLFVDGTEAINHAVARNFTSHNAAIDFQECSRDGDVSIVPILTHGQGQFINNRAFAVALQLKLVSR